MRKVMFEQSSRRIFLICIACGLSVCQRVSAEMAPRRIAWIEGVGERFLEPERLARLLVIVDASEDQVVAVLRHMADYCRDVEITVAGSGPATIALLDEDSPPEAHLEHAAVLAKKQGQLAIRLDVLRQLALHEMAQFLSDEQRRTWTSWTGLASSHVQQVAAPSYELSGIGLIDVEVVAAAAFAGHEDCQVVGDAAVASLARRRRLIESIAWRDGGFRAARYRERAAWFSADPTREGQRVDTQLVGDAIRTSRIGRDLFKLHDVTWRTVSAIAEATSDPLVRLEFIARCCAQADPNFGRASQVCVGASRRLADRSNPIEGPDRSRLERLLRECVNAMKASVEARIDHLTEPDALGIPEEAAFDALRDARIELGELCEELEIAPVVVDGMSVLVRRESNEGADSAGSGRRWSASEAETAIVSAVASRLGIPSREAAGRLNDDSGTAERRSTPAQHVAWMSLAQEARRFELELSASSDRSAMSWGTCPIGVAVLLVTANEDVDRELYGRLAEFERTRTLMLREGVSLSELSERADAAMAIVDSELSRDVAVAVRRVIGSRRVPWLLEELDGIRLGSKRLADRLGVRSLIPATLNSQLDSLTRLALRVEVWSVESQSGQLRRTAISPDSQAREFETARWSLGASTLILDCVSEYLKLRDVD